MFVVLRLSGWFIFDGQLVILASRHASLITVCCLPLRLFSHNTRLLGNVCPIWALMSELVAKKTLLQAGGQRG